MIHTIEEYLHTCLKILGLFILMECGNCRCNENCQKNKNKNIIKGQNIIGDKYVNIVDKIFKG